MAKKKSKREVRLEEEVRKLSRRVEELEGYLRSPTPRRSGGTGAGKRRTVRTRAPATE